ncbi:MAG: GNAT family N-acetyltransferase [Christensenella sp.]|nr:GNAT family N-acetyltransferase [Christensenella sp.]
MPVTFRPAEEKDTALLLTFIRALAEYEHMLDQVVATEALLQEWLFDRKVAEAFFALEGETEVGFALYFHNFSTFLGRGGIYLEDLFVLPEHRGKGHGKAILRHLAQIARARGCGRLEWACLDWNKPSIDFYLSLGAVPMDEWTVYRVSGASLIQLSGEGAEQTQDWEELS